MISLAVGFRVQSCNGDSNGQEHERSKLQSYSFLGGLGRRASGPGVKGAFERRGLRLIGLTDWG